MVEPSRKYQAGNGYRFGFNGKEKDNELAGTTTYDYGFRIYNPALVKFLSIDPLTSKYPWYTPYQFAGNKPIWAVDLDGLEDRILSSAISNNKYIKKIFELYDNSEDGKFFNTLLKSQTKFDVIYTSFTPSHSSTVKFDAVGNALVGNEGNTVPFGISSMEELKSLQDVYPVLKNVNEEEVKKTFESGKKLIVVGIAKSFLDPEKNVINITGKKLDVKKFTKHVIINGTEVVVHEDFCHATDILKETPRTQEEQHQDYHGNATTDSPSTNDVKNDPKYKETKMFKVLQGLEKLYDKVFKNQSQSNTSSKQKKNG